MSAIYLLSGVSCGETLNHTLRSRMGRLKHKTGAIVQANHYLRKYTRKLHKELEQIENEYFTYMYIEPDEEDEYEIEMEFYEVAQKIIDVYNKRLRKKLISLTST